MGKKTIKANWHVVIEPLGFGTNDPATRERQYKLRCAEIVEAVKRHVDDVGRVFTEPETEEVCEHCGCGWSSDCDCNGCCDQDLQDERDRAGANNKKLTR